MSVTGSGGGDLGNCSANPGDLGNLDDLDDLSDLVAHLELWQQQVQELLLQMPLFAAEGCRLSPVRSLQAQFHKVQHHRALPPCLEVHGRLQGVLVECHRFLKLLVADELFLAAARSPSTQQGRSQQMGDRLSALLELIGLILVWVRPDSPPQTGETR
jgi:hypothetical protein